MTRGALGKNSTTKEYILYMFKENMFMAVASSQSQQAINVAATLFDVDFYNTPTFLDGRPANLTNMYLDNKE